MYLMGVGQCRSCDAILEYQPAHPPTPLGSSKLIHDTDNACPQRFWLADSSQCFDTRLQGLDIHHTKLRCKLTCIQCAHVTDFREHANSHHAIGGLHAVFVCRWYLRRRRRNLCGGLCTHPMPRLPLVPRYVGHPDTPLPAINSPRMFRIASPTLVPFKASEPPRR